MEDSGEEHVRTVDKQENLAYIHYWFYPSSYDQWISNELIDGEAEDIEPPPGAWRVGERFITDLEKFNEWMVELDYEIDEVTPEPMDPSLVAMNATNGSSAHNYENDENINRQSQSISFAATAAESKQVCYTVVGMKCASKNLNFGWLLT